MKKLLKKIILFCAALVCLSALTAGVLFFYLPGADFGFARAVSEEEQAIRAQVVQTAEGWLGAQEGSGQHQAIVDLYNAHEPLAQGYLVTYEDNWCSTFASAIAIQCDLTEIIPTECGCERHISLFHELGRWEEQDTYIPLPGDYIFYDWDVRTLGDSTGWADHVGIVVGTHGPFIKVIEGNKNDSVSYRYILYFDPTIRGYGLPDYASECE